MTVSTWWDHFELVGGDLWANEAGTAVSTWDVWVKPAVRIRQIVCAAGLSMRRIQAATPLADAAWPLTWDFRLGRFAEDTNAHPDRLWRGLNHQAGPLAQAATLVPGAPDQLLVLAAGGPNPVSINLSEGTVGTDEGATIVRAILSINGLQPSGNEWRVHGSFALQQVLRVRFDEAEP
jgi:hypothetical protein